MSQVKLISKDNIGDGLHIEDSKLKVKVDGTSVRFNSNNQLEAVQSVDIRLAGLEIVNDTTLKATLTDSTTKEVSLEKFLNVDTNTYPVSISMEGKILKITLNNEQVLNYDLTTFINEHLKGDEVQDLNGNTLGYFLKA